MERYDKKFNDYLVLNQNNYDILSNDYNKFRDNTAFRKLQIIKAADHDSINKRSNNFIWMFFYIVWCIVISITTFNEKNSLKIYY